MPEKAKKNIPIGNLENFHRERHIFDLFFTHGIGRLSIITPNIIRVQYTTEKDWAYKPLLSIEEKEWKSVPIQIKRHAEKLDITTPRLIVSLVFRPFNIRIYDHEGHLISQDNPKCSASISGSKITVNKKVIPGCSFLGMGDMPGDIDRAGKTHHFEMLQSTSKNLQEHINPQIVFPLFFYKGKDQCVGFFLDNPAKATVNMKNTAKGDFSMATENGSFDYYIIIGQDFDEVTRGNAMLIGNPAFPPRWSLEIMKGLETPLESKSFLNQFNTIREEFLLTSSVIAHQPEKDATGFWDERPYELLKNFKRSDQIPHFLLEMDQSIHLSRIAEDELEQMVENRALVETSLNSGKIQTGSLKTHAYLDPFYDAGQNYITEKLSPLFKRELRGIEIGDPFPPWNQKSIKNAMVRCVQEIVGEDGESVEKLIHEIEAKHLIGYMPNGLAQAIYNAYQTIRPELRPILVSSSGYAGIQRYAIIRLLHSEINWEDVPQYLTRLISLNISGAPLLCADIELKQNFDELLTSRLILALSFVPLIRMKLAEDYELEQFLNSDMFLETLEFAFSLRETWLPYLYQLSWKAHQEGDAILYPTMYHFPDWPDAKGIQNEFMVGEHVFVAPFTTKDDMRTVILPPGLWADATNFEVHQGPKKLDVFFDDNPLPMYYREGAIVPSFDNITPGLEKSVVVTFFPKNDLVSESFLYDDDGDTTKYLNQQHSCIQMRLSSTKKGYVLKFSRRQGKTNPSWSSYLLKFIYSRLDIQRVVYNRMELTYFTSFEELASSKAGFYLDDELEMLFVKVPYEREGGVVRF